jgi:hypothetical protein
VPELTPEEAEQFKAEFERRMVDHANVHREIKWLPPGPPLNQSATAALLRECVTVVKPGETTGYRGSRSARPGFEHGYRPVASGDLRP